MEAINYIDRRTGELLTEAVPAQRTMKWLYGKPIGKATLHLMMKRKFVSALGGWYMNSSRSKKRIVPFVADFKIDMSDYLQTDPSQFAHFNDFFYRKINPAKRPLSQGVVSPADGKTLAFQDISDATQFFIKGSEFNLRSFLNSEELAKKYENGSMVIIRLAPTDYHRFHFPEDGLASETTVINGHYFSVSPIALQKSLSIFCQNKRTRCILQTEHNGDILISEVGATMVGSIFQTYEANSEIQKGAEKGYFAFGGSTVVLLFRKGNIQLSPDLLENTRNGLETQVLMGQSIGV